MGWLKRYILNWPAPIYVLLAAAFPVLYLYAHNVSQIKFSEAALPLGLSLAGAAVLWALLTLITRNARKAGLGTVVFVFFFFTYGHFYDGLVYLGVSAPKHAYLLAGILFVWGCSLYFIRRAKRDFRTTTTILNVIAVVLIAINLFNIASYEIKLAGTSEATPDDSWEQAPANPAEPGTLPDIYFIIFDEYSHPDTMEEWYDYDNSEFINGLEDRGFFIAGESKTRSSQTPQCLAQVLNMEYLTPGWEWNPEIGNYVENETNREMGGGYVWNDKNFRKIAYNEAAAFLRARGYQYITFVASALWRDYMKDSSDLYFNYYEEDVDTPWTSEFQKTLWNTTMLKPFYNRIIGRDEDYIRRHMTLGILEQLKKVPEMEGPNFIFAHLYCPHEPLVFGRNGEHISWQNYNNFADKKFYRDQYIFITAEIEKLVDALLEKSGDPPIIVIQSDHGIRPQRPGIVIGPDEWHKILNAMYLPGMNYTEISDAISPVNTFRLIFSHYFNADYPLLEND